ncbi:hypothetical protein G6O67_001790 [Ophiocordyceps sinensis]|uniref:Uncharacterized protein n=1 Tax=Ophiocordyceps sinensis TaxID=72228 RepID=A0A8H4PSY7_9HYPO|nr:hypothetical protein G6O67_001790 [Ophiocordyceps sinensis]
MVLHPIPRVRTDAQGTLDPRKMCTEHTATCRVCGKKYLIYVAFCHDYHPPLVVCPYGITDACMEMKDGLCPSPACPNSLRGGCYIM